MNAQTPGTRSASTRRSAGLLAAALVCIGCASSSVAPTTSPPMSAESTALPTNAFPAPADILPPFSLARVIVSGLQIRDEPRLAGGLVGTVAVDEVLMLGGWSNRTQADGIDWYSVSWLAGYRDWPLFPASWETGWVAFQVGDQRSLELQPPRCPDADPDLAALSVITDWERLACFGGRSVAVTGTFGCSGCGGTAAGTFEPAWLATPWDGSFLSADPVGRLGPITLHFAPASGIVAPPTASIVKASVHLNDPVSTTCVMGLAGEIEANRRMAELYCRERFVVDSLEITGTDPNFPLS